MSKQEEKTDRIFKVSEIIAPFFSDPIDDPCPYCEAGRAVIEAGYMTRKELAQDVSGFFSEKFEKMVCGLIKDTINQHGEINDKTKSSLAKRVARQILQVIRQSNNTSQELKEC